MDERGFEGIGDFESDDPYQRWIAHQAAKGNYPVTKSMDTETQIITRLRAKADEAFDPEEAIDSDGYDQGVREGYLSAIEVVKDVFYYAKRT